MSEDEELEEPEESTDGEYVEQLQRYYEEEPTERFAEKPLEEEEKAARETETRRILGGVPEEPSRGRRAWETAKKVGKGAAKVGVAVGKGLGKTAKATGKFLAEREEEEYDRKGRRRRKGKPRYTRLAEGIVKVTVPTGYGMKSYLPKYPRPGTKEFYTGRPYPPPTVKTTPAAAAHLITVKRSPAAQLLVAGGPERKGIELSKLREETRFRGTMPNPLGDISHLKRNLNLTVLRQIQVPRGWTKEMSYAYEEIRQNGDYDSFSHVVSELSELGVPRKEAAKAIGNLLKLGFVHYVEHPFRDKPELEVVK